MNNYKEKLDALFEELVPEEGKADSLAGEIVRAVSRIVYRWNNDGDRVGYGYGRETCNPAARFLVQKAPKEIADVASSLWGGGMACSDYEKKLNVLVEATVKEIEAQPELREQETLDMFDFTDLDEDRDDTWDEEEYYDDEEDY
jgi:hypothetical protein